MLPTVITFLLGGTRSGKSELAEQLAGRAAEAGSHPVTYVATGRVTDADMAARIAAHQARRPSGWATVEAGDDLPEVLEALPGPALVDSLGTWVAGFPDLDPDPSALCTALQGRPADTIVVSEEVGLGVHAPTEAGRRFADSLGTLNQAVADIADHVLLVIAGRALPLPPRNLPG
jgi:adenosyl cobinamide kinase/adenosyl cobinamide phosphate guanylyltransferase